MVPEKFGILKGEIRGKLSMNDLNFDLYGIVMNRNMKFDVGYIYYVNAHLKMFLKNSEF